MYVIHTHECLHPLTKIACWYFSFFIFLIMYIGMKQTVHFFQCTSALTFFSENRSKFCDNVVDKNN